MEWSEERIEDVYNDIKTLHNFDFDLKNDQILILKSLLEKKDVLAYLPTGFGKSILYTLPSLLLKQVGVQCVTVVIQPLTALIEDQLAWARSKNISAAAFHANHVRTVDEVQGLGDGSVDIIFCTPEAAKKNIHQFKEMTICLLAFDEAHCLTTWGMDFRPSYRDCLAALTFVNAPVIALTATATGDVDADLRRSLQLKEVVMVGRVPDRPRIFLLVCEDVVQTFKSLTWIIDTYRSDNNLKFLIYVRSKNACQSTWNWMSLALEKDLYKTDECGRNRVTAMFHADTADANKEHILHDFCKKDGLVKILVATSAFGMGVQVPDVDYVVHWGLPYSPLDYWQQAGRAGRDGRNAVSVLFKHSLKSPSQDELMLQEITAAEECVRENILKMFVVSPGETFLQNECSGGYNCPAASCCSGCRAKCRCSSDVHQLIDNIGDLPKRRKKAKQSNNEAGADEVPEVDL